MPARRPQRIRTARSIETTKSTVADTQRYTSILEGLPKAGISPDNLRALIGRFDALQQAHPADGAAADNT
jgi:hypothetical protein